MRKQILKAFFTAAFLTMATAATACTNFIVAKGASTDGSVMCTYNADDYGMFIGLAHYAAGTHQKGEMRKVIDWDTKKYHGEIPEAPVTYNVIGNINEFQVTIGETTYGGREEMVDTTGIIDYGSLIYIALQRSRTAREAIKVMTSLAEKYGYNSEGETFTICDPNEAWIMEMMGCGGDKKQKVVWVAVRVPDNAICGHANQSRIGVFSQYQTEVLHSKNVVSFARQKGWYKGTDKDFSWKNTYAFPDFSGRRWCEARVWSFFNHHKDMSRWLPWAIGKDKNAEDMPLWIVPNKKLSVQDLESDMRDHYEGTELSVADGKDMGGWHMANALPSDSFDIQGEWQELLQRAPDINAANWFLLCVSDEVLAATRDWWRALVWQRRRQHDCLHANILWQHGSARVLQHSWSRCRDILNEERLLGLQLGEQHGLPTLLNDVPKPEDGTRQFGGKLFRQPSSRGSQGKENV